MSPTEAALANGWSWVLGVSGEQTCCYPAGTTLPPETAEEALAEIAWRLGLARPDVEQILDRIDQLRRDYRTALRAAVLITHGPDAG
ncbi:hypothetical protein [Streptomyces cinnamoneus]|uniref:hypothetical protein n=1 Tax=Streptomyces cinnamoneus TaxID=53446 RepID=UPI000CEEF80F|nr:hypothetical protein [Streptomyces cinnamoneus]PPT14840.1 hypothetical protein CYQ11_19965 [Streptomyces cinnamoneus]